MTTRHHYGRLGEDGETIVNAEMIDDADEGFNRGKPIPLVTIEPDGSTTINWKEHDKFEPFHIHHCEGVTPTTPDTNDVPEWRKGPPQVYLAPEGVEAPAWIGWKAHKHPTDKVEGVMGHEGTVPARWDFTPPED